MNALRTFRELMHRVAGMVKFLPPLLARLTLGVVFVESGWGKLQNMPQTVMFFSELGIPAAGMMAPFVALVEVLGGAFVLVGFTTRVSSIPLAFTMVVAILTAKRAQMEGFTALFGMPEFLYIVLCTYLFVEGAGKISVDATLRDKVFGNTNSGGRHLRAA